MLGNKYRNIHIAGSARVVLGNEYTNEPKSQRILRWLSPLNPWAKHNEARGQYRQGTLDWFFDNATFSRWCDGDIQVLWCPGPMGTGKTILMSAIVEHLHQRSLAEPDFGMAFIYCQHQAREVQTLPNILGCLLSQLYAKNTEETRIPLTVSSAYSTSPNVAPTVDQMQQWLSQEIESRNRVSILLDGLDEVTQQLRDELLGALGFENFTKMQILVTSRPLPDIQMALLDPRTLHIHAPTSSIDALITFRLKSPSSRRFIRLIEADGKFGET